MTMTYWTNGALVDYCHENVRQEGERPLLPSRTKQMTSEEMQVSPPHDSRAYIKHIRTWSVEIGSGVLTSKPGGNLGPRGLSTRSCGRNPRVFTQSVVKLSLSWGCRGRTCRGSNQAISSPGRCTDSLFKRDEPLENSWSPLSTGPVPHVQVCPTHLYQWALLSASVGCRF